MTLLPLFLLLATKQCPPSEEVYPCSCRIRTSGPDVFCVNIGEDSLDNAFRKLKNHQFHTLTLSGLNVSTLKPDQFEGLQIERLDLERVEVDDASFRPGRKHFQGLEDSLEVLDIKKSFLTRGLGYLQLSHLSKLKDAIFENNRIAEVGNDWFSDGPSGLTTLIFERNGLEELGDKAFNSLHNLRTLAVAGNHIRELKRPMFPQYANELMILDLASNNLRELPSDLFSGMSKLMDLNLENNLIHLIQESTFSSIISSSTEISMKGNPLVCDEKLNWICKTGQASNVKGKCALPVSLNGKTVQQFCTL